MNVIRLAQDATAWDLIAETIKMLHNVTGSNERRDAFHKASLGLEEDFTAAKTLGESFGFRYIPGPRRIT
jgi:hypothetical protein